MFLNGVWVWSLCPHWDHRFESLKSHCANCELIWLQCAHRCIAICMCNYIVCTEKAAHHRQFTNGYRSGKRTTLAECQCTNSDHCSCILFSKYRRTHSAPREGCHSDKWLAKIGDDQFQYPCAQTGTHNAHNEACAHREYQCTHSILLLKVHKWSITMRG